MSGNLQIRDKKTTASAPLKGIDGAAQVRPVARFGASQNVAVGIASAQSTALTSRTVRLVATTDCWISVGANPTAVSTGASALLSAFTPETIDVDVGQKIAVLQQAAGGILNITEVTV